MRLIMNFVLFLRCLFKGHAWTKSPILLHEFEIPGTQRITKFKLGHGLHHCEQCGKVEFSPAEAS